MRHLPSPLGISSGKGSALNIDEVIEEAAEDREMDSLRSPEYKKFNILSKRENIGDKGPSDQKEMI